MGSHTLNMPKATLHLRGENLPNKESFGTSDPYFQVFYQDQLLYKSEVIENNVTCCEWEPAVFELPALAWGRSVRIMIMDKDQISEDDVMVECEIRYPFRVKSYLLSENDLDAKLCVLNDDGDSGEDSDDMIEEGFRDKVKRGFFKVLRRGKAL